MLSIKGLLLVLNKRTMLVFVLEVGKLLLLLGNFDGNAAGAVTGRTPDARRGLSK